MTIPSHIIESPESPAFDQLCGQLRTLADESDCDEFWPVKALQLCRQFGVYRWFGDSVWGGLGWSERDIQRGYLRLANASLIASFVITQWAGAIQRIGQSQNELLKSRLLPPLLSSDTFATLGISHLTTSRQHVRQPAVTAVLHDHDFVLSGTIPWVTAAGRADWLVCGATLENREQILLALDLHQPGVRIEASSKLVALTGSETASVKLVDVQLPAGNILAGPAENILAAGAGARTGGLQTSALALGLAQSAIDYLRAESIARPDLNDICDSLNSQRMRLEHDLISLAGDRSDKATIASGPIVTNDVLRSSANSLVLRSTQAALVAAKGTGFVASHPVGRWSRQALFFLIWSCPQSVATAMLRDLASESLFVKKC